MSEKKILFTTDFSSCSDEALQTATLLARDRGAKLLIVHVEEPSIVYGEGGMYYGMADPAIADQRRMLERLVPTDPEVAYEQRMIQGSPASAIVRLAEDEPIDMIVMSTHGRTGMSRVLMGSVAEEVVRRAPCPVLTLKRPAEKLAATD